MQPCFLREMIWVYAWWLPTIYTVPHVIPMKTTSEPIIYLEVLSTHTWVQALLISHLERGLANSLGAL